MNEIPEFEDAVEEFRNFLTKEGQPSTVLWVFREDIWQRSPTDIVLRSPSQIENTALARKVFVEGREKGIVGVHAIASLDDKVAATVWFPKFPGEEVQGWSEGMKLSFTVPLPNARSVGELKWLWFRLQPKFRRHRRWASGVGTKAWAESCYRAS